MHMRYIPYHDNEEPPKLRGATDQVYGGDVFLNEEPPESYTSPGAMSLLAQRSVKDRIWVLLYETMKQNIREGRGEITIYNELHFYNLCKADLIKSKRDKYKAIKAALKKLVEDGDVVKVNIKGEPWKSRDEEPWFHYNMLTHASAMLDSKFGIMHNKTEKLEELVTKLYNLYYDNKPVTATEQGRLSEGECEKLAEDHDFLSHYNDFLSAVMQLINIFSRPDMLRPDAEKWAWGMVYPKISLTYLPGPSAVKKMWHDALTNDAIIEKFKKMK
jgi:hypothetical protein